MFDFEKGPEFWTPSIRLGELLDALSFLDIAAPVNDEAEESRPTAFMLPTEEEKEPTATIQPDAFRPVRTQETIQPNPKMAMPGTKTDKDASIKQGRAMVDNALEGFDAFMNYEDLVK